MTRSPSFRSSPAGDSRAFVLVAVLLLVALVTVLVVTTSLLAGIERRAVDNATKTEIARQNALFALDTALGQLQKDLGPDQNVSARADILDTNNGANPQMGITGVNNPYWTGVWKAYNSGAGATQNLDVTSSGSANPSSLRNWSTAPVNGRPSASNTNMDWLVSGVAADRVSGNPTIVPTTWQPVTATSAGSSRNAVVVAKNLLDLKVAQTGTNHNTTTVAVPLVSMQASSSATTPATGHYAYWVSDEGVKAKATLADPTLGSNNPGYVKNQSHFLAPQADVMKYALPAAASGADTRADPDLAKVFTMQSLAYLTSLNGSSLSGSGAAYYSGDVTTCSQGVLADTRNGGLKRDLTAAFEDDFSANPTGQFQNLLTTCGTGQNAQSLYRTLNPSLAIPVVTAGAFAGTTVIDGLRWMSLYQYYNLFKNNSPLWRAKNGAATTPSGVQASNLGYTASPTGPYTLQQRIYSYGDAGGGSFAMDPVAPVVLEARVDIGLCSFVDPQTGNYRLRLRYYPMLVLYNPYGVRITNAQSASYNFYTNYFNINGRWSCTIKVNGTGIPPFDTAYSLIQGSGYPLILAAQVADVVSLDPGEIKVFALTADVARTTLGDPSTSNVCNIQSLVNSSVNMSADWAQTYDLSWAGTPNAGDSVAVSVGNMNLTANVAYENGSPICAWPDGSMNGAGNQRFQSLSMPSTTPTGTWPSPPIGSMTGRGYLLVGFNMRSKGIKATTDHNYYNWNYVPPNFAGNSQIFSDLQGSTYREVYSRAFTAYSNVSEVQMDNPADGQPRHTSWGDDSVGSDPVTSTNSRIVLRDVPCQPMLSLGQFSHLASWYYATSGAFANMDLTSRFIGGSFASADIPLNNNTATNNPGLGATAVAIDNSFMANQVLFDTYFLSTVPAAAQGPADASKYPMASSALDASVQNRTPLPDNRLTYYFKDGVLPSTNSNPTLSVYEAALRDVRKSASCLLVDGAFNVNSTSVNAWKALLSSLSGNSLRVWNYAAGTPLTFNSTNLPSPIPRFWNSCGVGTPNAVWDGMRALSDAELTELATRIVQQVKVRGPFLSMGDFLNRRLGAAKTQLNIMGALQAAIENTTSPDVNATAKARGTVVALNTAFSSGASAAPTYSATGIPGYLMQQDIVQAFAPVMAVRSDTFIVRCYGETNDLRSATVTGRAWGEAVVQRLPDYVDQADPALSSSNFAGNSLGDATPPRDYVSNPQSTPTQIVDNANLVFGRRFKVVSFRWLNETDL